MTQASDPNPARRRPYEWLRLIGLLLVLFPALLRASVTHDAFPFWSMDPAVVAPPIDPSAAQGDSVFSAVGVSLSGVGPTGVLLMDLVGLLGSALVLIGLSLGGVRVPWHWPLLASIGSVGALLHALVLGQGDLDHLRLGSSWICAIWSGLAVYCVAGDQKLRRLALGLSLGFIVVLALRGGVQVFAEHARTVADFDRNREAIFASRGWTEGSASALVYERRLRQPEALGWFGLSNVYASFAATASVVFLALAVPGVMLARKARPLLLPAIVLGVVAGLSLLALFYNDSKGGFASAAFGLGVLACVWLARRPLQGAAGKGAILATRWAGGLAIAIPLAALALRGLVGERIGELSLLFRWFYLVGSARIFGESPLIGVGPGGFQEAYAVARPLLSPEEVSSPHSVLFDWSATLGLFGVAWCVLLVLLALRAGRRPLAEAAETPAPASMLDAARPRLYAIAGMIAGVLAVSMYFERGASFAASNAMALTDAEPMPMWALGAGLLMVVIAGFLWGLCANAMLSKAVTPRVLDAAGLAGACVMLAHWQIEMTPTQASSAPLAMVIFGACAAGLPPKNDSSTGGRFARLPGLVGGLVPLLLIPTLWAGAVTRVAAWENGLADAARQLEPIARVRTIAGATDPRDRAAVRAALEEIRLQHGALLGTPPPQTFQELEQRLVLLELDRRPRAHRILTDAIDDLRLGSDATRRLLIEEAMKISERYRAVGEQRHAAAWAARALATAEVWAGADQTRFGPALMRARAAEAVRAATDADDAVARRAWERAHELAPLEPAPIRRLWALAEERGDTEQASTWAAKLLETDARFRLDPLRGLSESERERARRAARQP